MFRFSFDQYKAFLARIQNVLRISSLAHLEMIFNNNVQCVKYYKKVLLKVMHLSTSHRRNLNFHALTCECEGTRRALKRL